MTIAIVFILIIIIPTALFLFLHFAPQVGARAVIKSQHNAPPMQRNSKGQYLNVIKTALDMPPGVMLKTIFEVIKGDKSRMPDHAIEVPIFDKDKFDRVGNGEMAALCWFGHSSLLIKIHGKVFLTDPVLVGKRVSMFSFIGPHRFPYTHYVAISELPHIDAVLISHDHYDHLDYATIRMLKQQVSRFIVPVGVGAHLEKWGIPAENITEHEWWSELKFDDMITLACTPSRHFSGRSISERNKTLWCSWIIRGASQKIYFGADSGYSPSFMEIGNRYGPFDLTLLECGAYSKYWPEIHMMPEETLQAHLDLQGKVLMPIHWAKFNLSLHGWKEPIQRLLKAAIQKNVAVATPRIGAIFQVNDSEKFDHWWDL